MVIKIQREGHTLQRCLVADTRGKSFPVLLELAADRSQKGWRPRPQEPSAGFGTCGEAQGGKRPGSDPLATRATMRVQFSKGLQAPCVLLLRGPPGGAQDRRWAIQAP